VSAAGPGLAVLHAAAVTMLADATAVCRLPHCSVLE